MSVSPAPSDAAVKRVVGLALIDAIRLLHPGAAMDSELRIVRQGATFTLFARPVGAPQWQLLRSHVRPDLPATLEVGPMTYSLNAPAGIRARFEDFTVGP